jgi:hypothetical protein
MNSTEALDFALARLRAGHMRRPWNVGVADWEQQRHDAIETLDALRELIADQAAARAREKV